MADYKQATADFQLETRIRRIAQEIFTILLKSHDNIFEYVKENRGQMNNFEERIVKNEALCGQIDSKIDSRLSAIDVLSKDIQDIKQYCFQGLKNVNNDVSAFQRQVDEVRALLKGQGPIVQKTSKDIQRLEQQIGNLKGSISTLNSNANEKIFKDAAKSTEQIESVRRDLIQIVTQVSEAKDALHSKNQRLDELTCDLELFKFYKPEITQKITQLYEELANRALAVDVISSRKYFDDKMTGYFENVSKTVVKLDNDVKKRIKDNEEKTEKIFKEQEEITTKMKKQFEQSMNDSQAQQNKISEVFAQKISVIKESIEDRFKRLEDGLEEKDMQITSVKEISERNNREIKKSAAEFEDKIEGKIVKMEQKFILIDQNFNYNNQLLRDNQNQSDDLKAIVKDFRAQIQSFTKAEGQGTAKFEEIDQQIRKLKEIIKQQSLKIDSLNSQITEVSVGIHSNIQQINKRIIETKAEAEAIKQQVNSSQAKQLLKIKDIDESVQEAVKSMRDKFKDIKQDLKAMDNLSQDLKNFNKLFKQQLAENATLNKVVSDKIENAYSQITKFKSDFTIRLDSEHKQIIKISNELKNTDKLLSSAVVLLSLLSETLTIVMSCFVSRQFDSADKMREDITNHKFSSMIDGFVLELDANKQYQDSIRYRGQNLRRLSLLANTLQYFAKELDSMRKVEALGKQFENSKTIFGLIQLPTKKFLIEEANTTRRNSVSMRNMNKKDSSFVEFPKINKKE